MDGIRSGVLVLPDAPFPELQQRWRTCQDAGFDAVYVADHSQDYRDGSGHWFEGWTTLALLAVSTSRVRVGTLVTNPILRSPLLVAKAAATVDHLSGGRLEIGIGTGIAPFDHAAAGTPSWSPAERAARFREYVEVVDGLLCSAQQPFTYRGRHHAVEATSLVPAAVQAPRPPLLVGGQSPTVRRVAAERADGWNTHGPFGATVDEIVRLTGAQNREVDEWCEQAGRDPATLRRSLLLFGALDPWTAPGRFGELVERFSAVGMREFVAVWPRDADERRLFDTAVTDVLPGLRA